MHWRFQFLNSPLQGLDFISDTTASVIQKLKPPMVDREARLCTVESQRVFVCTIDRFSCCKIWHVVQFFPAYGLDLLEQAKLLWWHQHIKIFRLIACDWSLDLCLGKQYKCKKQESASQRDTRYHGVIWIYRWFAMDPSAGQVQVIEGDLEAMPPSLG